MPKLTYSNAALTQTRQRRHNEDSYDSLWNNGVGCWVMADGLGGHQGGEIASQLAVQSIIASFATKPEVSYEAIERYLEAAQNAILQRQKADLRLSGMRTTIVLLVANELAAMWGHAGDSRLYHFRNGQIYSQTKDHSVAQYLANSGEIRSEEIRFHEDRHRLLRVVGQDDDFRPTIIKTKQTLEVDDAFLLCTDGFWELVLEKEMEEDLKTASNPQEWLSGMEKRIEERILKETGKNYDNLTAMAVFAQMADQDP